MNIRLLILLLIPFFGICQAPPLQWSAEAIWVSDSAYTIVVNATVTPGWHVYASADESLGLEPPFVNWENENVRSSGTVLLQAESKNYKDPVFDGKTLKIFKTDVIHFTQPVIITGRVPASFSLSLKAFASNDKEFIPVDETKKVNLAGGTDASPGIKLAGVNLLNPVADCGDRAATGNSLLIIFFLGLLGGLIALLTPCVFPMIPVTVSFFTGKTTSRRQGIRNGLTYGLFIFFIYILASVPFHLAGNLNPEVFNRISTNAGVNIAFFIIFIFFALSFFGLFDITLPSTFANAAGARGGIFFMALTLVIVSFSCTGPILGSLLVTSLSGDGSAWQLTAGMAGFGLALALPFGLFAMFPELLKSLPRSGKWMDTVKKTLAFVELALAFKFLSNADLVKHWGLLKRELFIGIWIFIAIMLAFYLFGFFGPKKPQFYISPKVRRKKYYIRPALGMVVLLFAAYLFPGLTNSKYANLELLSGFPPPLSYSIYGTALASGKEFAPDVINDYDKALKLSREQHKPLLIDFTGWACVNCRKMEEQVWTKKEIRDLIRDKYILVSLYVDDRGRLPPDKQFVYQAEGGNPKDIRTLGDKWATFESVNFSYVSQPLYVVLNPEEKLLNNPVGYTPDEKEYGRWLKCGLKAFEQTKKLALNNTENNVAPVCVTAR